MNQQRKGGESSEGDLDDVALVETFLETVTDLSQREVARKVPGVTQSDVSRWKNNKWEYITGKKRRALKRYLQEQASRSQGQRELVHSGDPTGSPAERLIYYFSHPDAVRQLGPQVTPEDRVKAAYAIAIEDGWPEQEIDKLDAWRRETLRSDTGED